MTEVPSAGRTTGSANTPYPTPAPSLGRLFLSRVAQTPNREAFRAPNADGGWRSLTWQDSKDVVSELAAGLLALDLSLEDRVAIVSNTRLEWILADLAIMCAGGANTTVYPTTSEDDVEFILSDSNSVLAFAEDDKQVAKIKQVKGNLPELRKIIVIDGEGDGDLAISWADLQAMGREKLAESPNLIEETVDLTGPDKLATLIYTSGTTGRPKGVELTHSNWCYEGAAMDALDLIHIDDTQFLWLPLAHSFGKVLTSAQLQIGFMTAVDGRVPKIITNLPEVQPSVMAGVPRIFEKVYAGVNAQFAASPAKAKIAAWALRIGDQVAAKRNAGEPVPGRLNVQYGIAEKLVFSKIKAKMGGRVSFFISGSAALNQDIAKFFDAAGLPILEGYGLTETSAATCVNRLGALGPGTVGAPLPGTEIRIADDGEILIKGPGVMRGYRNRPEANEEAFAPGDGWFASGDIGIIDDQGRVKITDRKKDLVKTSGGKYIAPGAIESAFKGETGLAGACVVVANDRNFASALIGLDPDAAKAFAEAHGLPNDIATLSQDPTVTAEIQAAIDRLNSKLNRWETIKQFRILPYVLDPEATPDQVTPSMKIKRKAVESFNADLVESMYTR
jgi:long-chain acyl-CoA synthetase